MRTFHIGGTAQVVDSVVPRSERSKARSDPQPQRRAQLGRQLVAMGRNMVIAIVDARTARNAPRTASPTARAAWSTKAEGEARPAYRRMGSVHPSDPDRSRRHRGVRGSGRRHLGARNDRRIDRHHQARGHRLAFDTAWLGPEAGHRHQGRKGKSLKLARGGDARYLLSVDAILSVEPGRR
jgi:DNA-directed RNA polymerase subunit beta'